MKISKILAKATVIAIVLLMAFVTLVPLPVEAQKGASGGSTGDVPGSLVGSIPLPAGVTPDISVPTIAFLSISPNPVGIGQTILETCGLTPQFTTADTLEALLSHSPNQTAHKTRSVR